MIVKHFLVFLLAQIVFSSSESHYEYDNSYESSESSESKDHACNIHDSSDYTQSSEEEMNSDTSSGFMLQLKRKKYSRPSCNKDESLISRSDIKYLISEMAAKLKVRENIENTFYPEAKNFTQKYTEELEEFKKTFEARPRHISHILEVMAGLRQDLEPTVQDTQVQLQEFQFTENKCNATLNLAADVLKQIDMAKKICEINCHTIRQRFGPKPLDTEKMYCMKVKDLNEYIYEKLSRIHLNYDEVLQLELKNRVETYKQNITELKNNLKIAAVKKFGMIMYDILSLQDDYYHFSKELKEMNISTELFKIEENCAEIKLRIIGVKRDMHKYKQYCMKCNNYRRIKRDLYEYLDHYSTEDNFDIPSVEDDSDTSSGEYEFYIPSAEDDFYLPSAEDEFLIPCEEDDISVPSAEDESYIPSAEGDFHTPSAENYFYTPSVEDNFDIPSAENNFDIPIETSIDTKHILDDLIQAEIDEIKKTTKDSFTSMLEVLHQHLDDTDFVKSYVEQLHSLQHSVQRDIQNEQEALDRLKNGIPEESIHRVLELSKKSLQMLEDLKQVKLNIESVKLAY